MKKVYLVRHGESESNVSAQKRAGQEAGFPLTEKGRKQALVFAQSFQEKPSLIVTSTYTRSKETALVFLQQFPDVFMEEWVGVEEFNYIESFSSKEEKLEKKQIYWENNNPEYRDGTTTETFTEFFKRGEATLQKIVASEHKSIVLFSHGKFMRLIATILTHPQYATMSKAMKDFISSSYRVPNCGVLELLVDDVGCIYLKDMRGF